MTKKTISKIAAFGLLAIVGCSDSGDEKSQMKGGKVTCQIWAAAKERATGEMFSFIRGTISGTGSNCKTACNNALISARRDTCSLIKETNELQAGYLEKKVYWNVDSCSPEVGRYGQSGIALCL